MANRTQTIRIESILGGHAPTTHFAAEDQFRASLGIDPGSPITDDATDVNGIKPSGLLRPIISKTLGGDAIGNNPLWMVGTRTTSTIWIYDARGSIYTISPDVSSVTGLSDGGNESGDSKGNGAAYYDNYMYFSRCTTIARYGPLDGTPTLTGDFWGGTLGLTALTDVEYPLHSTGGASDNLPNHFLHRHSDGRLYVADVVDNQATIHYIQTTKTTVEGDTNDGSKYDALNFGYGLVPVAIESYGDLLMIAMVERSSELDNGTAKTRTRSTRAKVAFWDTTSKDANSITWVEFPDTLITAVKNINGVLYFFSTSSNIGYRVTRYIGGNSFEEILAVNDAYSPFPGAVDGSGDRILFGSRSLVPVTRGCIYSIGLATSGLSSGLFCPYVCKTTEDVSVTSLILSGDLTSKQKDHPMYGFGNTGGDYGIESLLFGSTGGDSWWWSQMYRIGEKFKITRIRLPLTQAVAANMIVVPKVYTDDGIGTTYTLATINDTNYPNSERYITYRSDFSSKEISGFNNFWLELKWTGTEELTVGLPIIVEYEIIDD
jgi:hypothetical protein